MERIDEIILELLTSERVNFNEMLKKLNVSRRTLYYDITKINERIQDFGEVIKVENDLLLTGDYHQIEIEFKSKNGFDYEQYLSYENRKSQILIDIIKGLKPTKMSMSTKMLLSETTITQTIKHIKDDLTSDNLEIYFEDGYKIKGDEIKIRELYLNNNRINNSSIEISDEVKKFNRMSNLQLTDYSLLVLSDYVKFINSRISNNNFASFKSLYKSSSMFKHFNNITTLLNICPIEEQKYLSAYVSSLSSLNEFVNETEIIKKVDTLLYEVEQKLLIFFKDKEECKRSLTRHLFSSYNRIKYQFPIINPLMNEIKIKYPSLFRLTKSVFKESNSLEDLKDIRDEEIAFIVSYIGAYIERDSLEILKKKRILIVCPNGITVTKTLQYQLEKHFPQLHIVDSLPLSKLKTINRNDYDWIISTVEIRDTQNVIMVNPLLKNSDLSIISKNIFHDLPGNAQLSIDDLITIYGKYGEIRDIDGLKNELYKKVFNKKNHKGGSKMLSELLTKDKIKIVDICENWQSAIKEAANVLLEKGEIEDSYVNAMIQSLVDHGPYIVLDDYLALAHARPEDGVNELSMSLLKISKGFDLLGKEVKLLIVLAASDNEKHIKALSSLTDLFMDKKNIDIILNTNDIDVIFELIKKYS